MSTIKANTITAATTNADINIAANGTGIDVPAAIQQWRNEIRRAASVMEDAISQAATTDAVAALFVTYTSNDNGSVTKSGMLYDWPELA